MEVLVNQDSSPAQEAKRALRDVEDAERVAFVAGWVRGLLAGQKLAEEPYEPQKIEHAVKSEA